MAHDYDTAALFNGLHLCSLMITDHYTNKCLAMEGGACIKSEEVLTTFS